MTAPSVKEDVAVIGAGISGLACAYYLAKAGHRVSVFEKENKAGGFLASVEINGSRVERYYHHLLGNFGELVSFIEELGLEERLSWNKARMGFFYKDNLFSFNGPLDLLNFRPLSFLHRVRLGIGLLRLSGVKDWKYFDGFNARELLERKTGRESWEKIWKPLLKMKFGGAYSEVSAAWIWERIRSRSSSRKLGGSKESLGYLKSGFMCMVERLQELVVKEKGEIFLSTAVTGISLDTEGSVELTLSDGKARSFSKVISTVALPVLMGMKPGFSVEAEKVLNKVRYQDIVCVLLRLKKQAGGFYWINMVDDNIPFGVIVEHTNLAGSREYGSEHLVYLVRYCSQEDGFFSKSEDHIAAEAKNALRKVFPDISNNDIAGAMVFKDKFAQPVFSRGFSHLQEELASLDKRVVFADSTSSYPRSRSVNSAVALARKIAREFN